MGNDFLFNDDDPKARGKGVDVIGNKKDFKYSWGWGGFNKGKPHQVSSAEIGNFTMEAIFWHSSYEARIHHLSDTLASIRDKFMSRIDAQHGAEKLLQDWVKNAAKVVLK